MTFVRPHSSRFGRNHNLPIAADPLGVVFYFGYNLFSNLLMLVTE